MKAICKGYGPDSLCCLLPLLEQPEVTIRSACRLTMATLAEILAGLGGGQAVLSEMAGSTSVVPGEE